MRYLVVRLPSSPQKLIRERTRILNDSKLFANSEEWKWQEDGITWLCSLTISKFFVENSHYWLCQVLTILLPHSLVGCTTALDLFLARKLGKCKNSSRYCWVYYWKATWIQCLGILLMTFSMTPFVTVLKFFAWWQCWVTCNKHTIK